MSQNNKAKVTKVAKKEVLAGSKKVVKEPKFKLISYTLKAVIPTGQFANIQPEVTVQAATIQDAERAVMPYIESLFAKYRNGGSSVQVQVTPAQDPIKPVVTAPAPAPVAPVVKEAQVAPTVTQEAPIVLTVPFNRAKSAVESCTSKEALQLVSDQITKSTKLTDSEKNTLSSLVAIKLSSLHGTN